jgi:hypothetical protein
MNAMNARLEQNFAHGSDYACGQRTLFSRPSSSGSVIRSDLKTRGDHLERKNDRNMKRKNDFKRKEASSLRR